MPAKNAISIVVCSHNRATELDATLQSLETITVPDVDSELLVVLNGCQDESEMVVQRRACRIPMQVRMINEPRLGLSHARNRGLRESRGEIIAFLDDDVKASPGWLSSLTKGFAELDVDIVAGRTLLWWRDCSPPAWWSASHFTWVLSGFDHGNEDLVLPRVCAVGANFAVSRKVYEAVGGFDPNLGRRGKSLRAGEESEFLRRAELVDFKAAYVADAMVEHLVPRKRVNMAYFAKVARGYGEAYYVINKRKGWRRWACICRQAILYLKSNFVAAVSSRGSTVYVLAKLKCNSTCGALNVLLNQKPI